MVVPMAADGLGQGLQNGDDLTARQPVEGLRTIKGCVLTLLLTVVVKFTAGCWLGLKFIPLANLLANALPILFLCHAGTLLLKDDPFVGRIHRCLNSTVCTAFNCQGGMNCLCWWVLWSLLCFSINALPGSTSDLTFAVIAVRAGSNPHEDKLKDVKWNMPVGSPLWMILMWLLAASCAVSVVAQVIALWKGHSIMRQLASNMAGAEDAAFDQQVQDLAMGQANAQQARQGQDAGPIGPEGFPVTQTVPHAPTRPGFPGAAGPNTQPVPPQAFQAFSGEGQKLG